MLVSFKFNKFNFLNTFVQMYNYNYNYVQNYICQFDNIFNKNNICYANNKYFQHYKKN